MPSRHRSISTTGEETTGSSLSAAPRTGPRKRRPASFSRMPISTSRSGISRNRTSPLRSTSRPKGRSSMASCPCAAGVRRPLRPPSPPPPPKSSRSGSIATGARARLSRGLPAPTSLPRSRRLGAAPKPAMRPSSRCSPATTARPTSASSFAPRTAASEPSPARSSGRRSGDPLFIRPAYRCGMRRTRFFLLGLVLVSLVEAARQWNLAPGRIPSHFDAAGRPNAWSSRGEFFAFQIAVTLGVAALFVGVAWLLKSTPARLINLPNKSYWLAPERRGETMYRLASSFEVFACATVLLLLVVFELTSLAGRGGTLDTSVFLPVLVLYLVFSAVWTVVLIRTFANVPTERSARRRRGATIGSAMQIHTLDLEFF